MQLHYAHIAPPSLLRASHVIQLEQNVLILAANNSAIAAKLRQMTPEFVSQLQLRGCEVTGIQVRVQVNTPPDTYTTAPASISVEGKQLLNELAETLADSPLKRAIQRLAATKKSGQ